MNSSKAIAAAGAGGLAVGLALGSSAEGDTPAVTLAQQGWAERDIETPSGRMRVYEHGPAEGPRVLLLHGIGDGASSYAWKPLAAVLGDYRLIAPDLIGWGASHHPDRSVLFKDYVLAIATLLDEVGGVSAAISASLACGFAIQAGLDRPGRTGAHVFLSPSGGRDHGRDQFQWWQRALFATPAKLPGFNQLFYNAIFKNRGFIQDYQDRFGFPDGQPCPADYTDAQLWSARQSNARYSALPFVTGELRYDLAPLLSRVDVPAIMLWGGDEKQIVPETVAQTRALNPRVEVRTVDGAKAAIPWSHPQAVADAVAKVI